MGNHDNILIKSLITKNSNIKAKYYRFRWKYPRITEYLENRFLDSHSIIESINRIRYKIYNRPICKYCGKEVKYLYSNKFADFCSLSCKTLGTKEQVKQTCLEKYGDEYYSNRDKYKQTCLEKYGVDNPNKSYKIREKTKQTCLKKYGCNCGINYNKTKKTKLKRYGDEYYSNRDKYKQTCLEKYGVDNSAKDKTIINKTKQTCLEKYGCVSPTQNINIFKKVKDTTFRNYGVYYISQSEYIKQKIYETKKRNNTFNTSKPEEELFIYIKNKFPDVKRQYKDKRYPWKCDFYIPKLDCFIEYNGFHTHGTHKYDKNSKQDNNIVQLWKQRYNNGEHPLYMAMINTWTNSDVKKRNMAIKENLNFHEFWNLNDAKLYIDSL